MTESQFETDFQRRHDAVAELLPWFVNGTLSAEERETVESHLGECLVCRRELEACCEIAEVMLDGAVSHRAEVGLQALHQRIAVAPQPNYAASLPWAAVVILSLVTALCGSLVTQLSDAGNFDAAFETLGSRDQVQNVRQERLARMVFQSGVR